MASTLIKISNLITRQNRIWQTLLLGLVYTQLYHCIQCSDKFFRNVFNKLSNLASLWDFSSESYIVFKLQNHHNNIIAVFVIICFADTVTDSEFKNLSGTFLQQYNSDRPNLSINQLFANKLKIQLQVHRLYNVSANYNNHYKLCLYA